MTTFEDALEWFVRVHEQRLSPEEREQFAKWLAESPANVREYLSAGEVSGVLASLPAWPADSTQDLLDVVARENGSNVYPLGMTTGSKPTSHQESKRARIWPTWAAAALVAGIAITLGSVWLDSRPGAVTYQTARGEQRSLVLADGSIVQLNTLTHLTVYFDQHERRLALSSGEALFRVAHDKARPFIVDTPYASIRAVGTSFDVYNRNTSTDVAVIEGKVTVKSSADGAANTPIPLAAGQLLAINATAVLPPPSPTPTRAMTWVERRISLDDDSVAAAVEEFNRYNRTQLRIEDEDIAKLRISGVFNADDPEALVQYLEEVKGVKVLRESSRIVLKR